ncbi:DUF305 domain-containing protein [Actinoplanes siamensis]|uniref:DUF305 domain-containing protein n=1 Tax=Actinoplanes siamensis TaxID=1223317 RepID=UPI0019429FFE|nr:DUF305 domain-containing protein [Actinoplanes siamensis]
MFTNPRILAASLLLGLAACAGPADPPPAQPSKSTFGGTDLAWVEINIAMNEELLPLLDLAGTKTADPGLKDLSAQVRTFTTEELGTLRELHDEAGLPSENPHKGMPMPGMVTPSLLAEASRQRGENFDDLLAKSLREHLEQGQKLATGEQASGAETRTKELAARILRTRAATLEKLREDY